MQNLEIKLNKSNISSSKYTPLLQILDKSSHIIKSIQISITDNFIPKDFQIKQFQQILNRYQFSCLEVFSLQYLQINLQQLKILRDTTNLKKIIISDIYIDEKDIECFFVKSQNQMEQKLISRQFPQLQQLELETNYITNAGILQLSKISCPKLKYLNLNWNQLSHPAGGSNIDKLKLPSLEKLQLKYCGLTDEDFKKINSQNLPLIKCLEVSGNKLFGKYFFNKIDPQLFSKLQSLSLYQTKIQEGLKFHINFNIDSKPFPSLKKLNLNCCKLTKKSFHLLLKFIQIENLQFLDLGFNNLGNDIIRTLSKKKINKLFYIDLSHNYINDNSIKYLLNFQSKSMKKMILHYNPLKITAALRFQKLTNLDNTKFYMMGINKKLLQVFKSCRDVIVDWGYLQRSI